MHSNSHSLGVILQTHFKCYGNIFYHYQRPFSYHMFSFFLIPIPYFSGPTFNRSPAKKAVDAIGSKPIPSFCSKMVWVPTITFFNLTNHQQLYCVWVTRVTRQIKDIGTEGRRNCSNWATFILEENQFNQNSCKDRLWQPQGACSFNHKLKTWQSFSMKSGDCGETKH